MRVCDGLIAVLRGLLALCCSACPASGEPRSTVLRNAPPGWLRRAGHVVSAVGEIVTAPVALKKPRTLGARTKGPRPYGISGFADTQSMPITLRLSHQHCLRRFLQLALRDT